MPFIWALSTSLEFSAEAVCMGEADAVTDTLLGDRAQRQGDSSQVADLARGDLDIRLGVGLETRRGGNGQVVYRGNQAIEAEDTLGAGRGGYDGAGSRYSLTRRAPRARRRRRDLATIPSRVPVVVWPKNAAA